MTPLIEQHDYDPGERRHVVRRMEDRIARVESGVRRAYARRESD